MSGADVSGADASGADADARARGDFSGVAARTAPGWAREGVIYEINTRTFSPGGDFDGVTARLDALAQLGVTVVWLMPIHPIGEERKKGGIGSPYAVRDYLDVNPAYGTKDAFRRLVTEAHRVGLRVIIDVVAHHTSWDSTMMATPEFYRRDDQGGIVSPGGWADVVALDYRVPALREHMIAMMQYWLREFDLDGFRCDVAGLVPTAFWEEARPALDAVKPDILMLAEWHEPELLAGAFEVDYSWPLYYAVADVITAGAAATTIRGAWENERSLYPRGSLHLRFTDNHDEKRAIARFGERGALAASALMFTLDGIPLLFNGMEAGDVTESGAPALFERLPIFWPIAERRPEFGEFYRWIIPLRRSHPALCQGETVWLHNSDEARVLTYQRRDETSEFLVCINLSSRQFTGTVDDGGGPLAELTPGAEPSRPFALGELALDAWGFRVFRRNR